MGQGKRKEQLSFSEQMVFGSVIGIVAIWMFCLVAVVVAEVMKVW